MNFLLLGSGYSARWLMDAYFETLRYQEVWNNILSDFQSDYTMIPQNGNPHHYGIASRNAYHRNRKKKRHA